MIKALLRLTIAVIGSLFVLFKTIATTSPKILSMMGTSSGRSALLLLIKVFAPQYIKSRVSPRIILHLWIFLLVLYYVCVVLLLFVIKWLLF